MQPSGQPRLTPNGGSPIRPGPLIVGIIMAFTAIAFPPILLVGIPMAAGWILVRWSCSRQRKRLHRQHLRQYESYYVQWRADQAPTTNPGWRL